MRHESQARAIEALEESLLFLHNLPEWVELNTVRVMFLHCDDPNIGFQVSDETFARLFAGQTLDIFACGSESGPMATGVLDGFEFYAGVPGADSNGPYVMPWLCPICGGNKFSDPLPGTLGSRCNRCCDVSDTMPELAEVKGGE